jgi:hypothetical protein
VPAVPPNLVGLQGYAASTVTDLVRAIVDIYDLVAVAEGVPRPAIRFGRRLEDLITAPPCILIVPRKGPVGAPREMGAGNIGSLSPLIEAHIWGPEPTMTAIDLDNELARFDAVDPMLFRFVNVLQRVAAGKIEHLDADPDAGQADPAAVNNYGEEYVYTFRFLQDVPRDGVVFAVLPDLDADGRPTPQLSPPPNHAMTGAPVASLSITATPKE